MGELISWAGSKEEIKITYDFTKPEIRLLPESASTSLDDNLLPNEDEKKQEGKVLADIEWDDSVKKTDKLDYELAVCSGIVAGAIDIFFVGEFSLDKAYEWGKEKVESFVKRIAKLDGYKGDNLSDAISRLERRHGMASDQAAADFGGGKQHHFKDFSHHFSIGGLMCSIFTQFSKLAVGTNAEGNLLIVPVTNTQYIGKNFEEKIYNGVIEWFYHMVSDMAGSNNSAGAGTGIPGPILSLIKEMSILPIFENKKIKKTDFRDCLSNLFKGNNENQNVMKFDLRTEIGLFHELGRQAIPVVINECIVRAMYFIRRIHMEITRQDLISVADLKKINPETVLPLNNAVVLRMLTVASGTFTVIDLADAGIRGIIKNKGINPKFWIDFTIRINFVGVGRFVIACGMDAKTTLENAKLMHSKNEEVQDQFEKELSSLDCLSLTFEQTRMLFSLEYILMQYDIDTTKNKTKAEFKNIWKEYWKSNITKGLPIIQEEKDEFLFNEEDLIRSIQEMTSKEANVEWLYLITMEALLFEPYSDEGIPEQYKFKKQELGKNYILDVFCVKQKLATKHFIESLGKTASKYTNLLKGKTKRKTITVAGTIAFTVATGGLAFTMAPAIAPVIAASLFGESFVGLSGAAFTSATLATVGGGALASGGFGMAGGTAVITGGGAVLGFCGGSGISSISTLQLLSDEGYVISECTKLLTFSKEVLIDKYGDSTRVESIRLVVLDRVEELHNHVQSLKDSEDTKDQKKLIKVCERCLKHFRLCATELGKLERK